MIHSIAQKCMYSSPKAFDFAFLLSHHLIRLLWSLVGLLTLLKSVSIPQMIHPLLPCILGRKSFFGMNTMKNSSEFKFSYHLYSNAYELVYGLDVMMLTCSSSCFNIHMTCMSRSKTRVEVAVHCSFRFAHILAYQSIGLESRGDLGSLLVHGRGAQVHGNL
jgi:hypothetical protein